MNGHVVEPRAGATPRFHHTDPGQAEASWLSDPHWDSRPVLDLASLVASYPRVLVLSAHPDDETLGVGALIAALARLGAVITVLVATAGEHSHPDATTWTPADLAVQRRREVEQAVAELDELAGVRHLDLPDGELADHEDDLAERIGRLLTPGTLVLAPWIDDGHPDHDALGRAARRAVAEASGGQAGCRVLHYPIWLWHWCAPGDAPWELVRVVEPSAADLHRKHRAISRFPSQTGPLGPLPGDRAVLTEAVVARAHRVVEVLIDPSDPPLPLAYAELSAAARAATFDAMYDGQDDPWQFTDSFYELRKRNLVLAMLGRRRYPRVLEVGCATGELARALAVRAGHVTGLDTSERALAVAGRSTQPLGTGAHEAPIAWVWGHVPGDLPSGPFDLIVLSEVGYFLTPLELLATLRRVEQALAAEGEVALVHWRHPTKEIPLDGELVHAQARQALGLPHRAGYADEDLRIDIWGAPLSVAATEDRR